MVPKEPGLSGLMFEFTSRAVVMKDYKLGGLKLKKKIILCMVLEAGCPKSRCQQVTF